MPSFLHYAVNAFCFPLFLLRMRSCRCRCRWTRRIGSFIRIHYECVVFYGNLDIPELSSAYLFLCGHAFFVTLASSFWVLGLGVTPPDHIMSPRWLVIDHTIK